jgi:hypothetical protein
MAFAELQALVRPLLDDPSPLTESENWTELLEEMTVDVNLTVPEAKKRQGELATTCRLHM